MSNQPENPYQTPVSNIRPNPRPSAKSTWRTGILLGGLAGIAPFLGFVAVFLYGWLAEGRSTRYLELTSPSVAELLAWVMLSVVVGIAIGGLAGLTFDWVRGWIVRD